MVKRLKWRYHVYIANLGWQSRGNAKSNEEAPWEMQGESIPTLCRNKHVMERDAESWQTREEMCFQCLRRGLKSRCETLRKAVSATLACGLRTDIHRHVAKSQDQRSNIQDTMRLPVTTDLDRQ
jgi:hypothetical protein